MPSTHFDVRRTAFFSKRVIAGVVLTGMTVTTSAQEFVAGEPIGAVNQAGVRMPMSDNGRVFGSFHFSESCTFDPARNLILAMNTGNRGDGTENDGFVSLIHPDGSVHTPKWIGATRAGLELHQPLGSAVSNGMLYTVDTGHVKSFDLASGRPLRSVAVPDSTVLNGIAVAADGTVCASNTRSPRTHLQDHSGWQGLNVCRGCTTGRAEWRRHGWGWQHRGGQRERQCCLNV